jgi:hypothetical protein
MLERKGVVFENFPEGQGFYLKPVVDAKQA